MDSDPTTTRLVIVSNRLPIIMERTKDNWRIAPGSGGLVTALAPVLRDRGGLWIGWPGTTEPPTDSLREAIAGSTPNTGYDLVPVFLDADEKRHYYRGFSNEIIWPLFHDMQVLCRFAPRSWEVYKEVNARFAEAVINRLRPRDFVWIHDYHLMQVAAHLRQAGIEERLGFFLHIPFPPVDIFLKLPWRHQVLADLLAHDLIGFQSRRDRRNFVGCVRALYKDETVVRSQGAGTTINFRNRDIQVGVFPISIDYAAFARDSASDAVAEQAWYVHENFPDRQIILGVDRLDYTKGLPDKLRAYRAALRRYPDLQGRVTLVQVVVPSRWDIPHYSNLKEELDRLVGKINGEFTRPGWVPLHYMYRSIERTQLLAYYRTAEVMLVTPWKDGMNLVAKEYIAADHDEQGALVLSEFAGATAQLHRHVIVVNPHDIEGMATAIHDACIMPSDERRRRMRRLRQSVRRQDVFWWVNAFLEAALHRSLDDFPVLEDYYPGPPGLTAEA